MELLIGEWAAPDATAPFSARRAGFCFHRYGDRLALADAAHRASISHQLAALRINSPMVMKGSSAGKLR